MPALVNYTQFDGRYPDTGVIRNVLDYQGVKAPHTNEPYSEALLLGISGGIAFGYFTFHYDGYDPQVNLLTRNTFEPMETILERMAIPREILQTTSADKGRHNLIRALEDGYAPIVWADIYSLPYNATEYDENNWGTFPIVVYGYDLETREVLIADRAFTGLTATTDELDTSRSRVKKDKQKLMLLEHPDETRLTGAVRAGIMDCIALMTEKPPRGSAKNFGLKALQHWAAMLEKNTKGSWAREYPSGRELLAVLISSYTFTGEAFGKTVQADRDMYADFLEEAAIILSKPELDNVAARYRMAGRAWDGLRCALLPEDVPMLKETRFLIDVQAELFLEKGTASIDERLKYPQQLDDLKTQAAEDFPMSEAEIAELRDEIRRHVLLVHDAEQEAVMALKAAMA